MNSILTITQLQEEIKVLEKQQSIEKEILIEKFQATYEEIKPINLIRNTLKEANVSSLLSEQLFTLLIQFGMKQLKETLLPEPSRPNQKSMVPSILLIGMALFLIKNPELLTSLTSRRKESSKTS